MSISTKISQDLDHKHNKGTYIRLSGLALIAAATLAIGIALLCGAPISPWWLLAPIASPFALGLAGVALVVISAIIIFASCLVAFLVLLALSIICAIPVILLVILYMIKIKLFD